MSLENVQGLHNSIKTAAANTSASNDPFQMPHDANEIMLKGAAAAAAGVELDMSEQELLKSVSRKYRRQKQRAAYQTRQQRTADWQRKKSSLGNWGDGEIEGVSYQDEDDLAFASGEDVEYNQRTGSTRADDSQTYRPDDRGFTLDEETGEIRRTTLTEERPIRYGEFEGIRRPQGGGPAYRFKSEEPVGFLEEAVSAESAQRQALNELRRGTDLFGFSAFPGAAQAVGALEDAVENPSAQRDADAALAGELVRRDSQRFNSDAERENWWKAYEETQKIAQDQFLHSGSGALADDAIGRIGEIRSLRKIDEQAQVVHSAGDAIRGEATRRADGIYVDAGGIPVPTEEPLWWRDGKANSPSSANLLNAPQSALEWIGSTTPGYREGGRTFGDFPQVDITRETTNFSNRLRDASRRLDMKGLSQVSGNIRSAEELQKVINLIAAKKQAQGKSMSVKDFETGEILPAGRNVVSGVMKELRMGKGDQERLANALFQLEAQRRSGVNQNPSGTYLSRTGQPTEGVEFDAREALNKRETNTRIAMQKEGTKIDGSDIVAELRKLTSPDAAKPFIGAEAGARSGTSSPHGGQIYNRSGETSPEGIEREVTKQAAGLAKRDRKSFAPGSPAFERNQENVRNAQFVQERADRDLARRSSLMSDIISSLPPVARSTRIR